MKISVLQVRSIDDETVNLAKLDTMIRTAAAEGSKLVVLPEVAYYRGRSSEATPDHLPGRATKFICHLAKELGIWIHGGSFAESIPGSNKCFNTAFLSSPEGNIASVYRKIHLFNVDLPDLRLMESDTFDPGRELITAPVIDADGANSFTIGMLVCYDLRFPAVWSALRDRGANVFALPVNFTWKTGEAHWEVLLRARAIETQSYVAASAQWGEHPHKNFSAYGRAMIVDPWGVILAQAGTEGDIVISADISLEYLESVRRTMPVHGHKRNDIY
ncbi:MAG: carbon-nitrogen hydrolase family protein [Candidatus Hydrogenedentota bacterium]